MSDPAKPSLLDHLSTNLLRILPQHLLAAGMYRLARSTTPWLKNLLIRQISRHYGVNMAEAEEQDLAAYPSFNAFFTRALKADARPLAAGSVMSPADGRVNQLGDIHGEALIQAKGHEFDLQALLAGDKYKTAQFRDGLFATIYLSPKDYHRIHMPIGGRLQRMIHVPGRLFSVAPYTVRQVPRLFARNERVISIFETDSGPLVMVLVGAMLVSSTETVWAGEVTPTKNKDVTVKYYSDEEIKLAKGEEMGRFNMGSTVIMLMPSGALKSFVGLGAGDAVKVGQKLGEV